jgi:hypothetical protein
MVVLICRDGILLPAVVQYPDYDFACNGIQFHS